MPLILDAQKRQYIPYVHSKEEDFERVVKQLSEFIFGPSTIYLDIKKRIKGNEIISIPDGYLIDMTDPTSPKLYVVENEIVKHDAFNHVGVQMLRFITSFEQARSNIRKFLMKEIENTPVALKILEESCKKSEYRNIDNYLDAAVYSEFKGLVLIDEVRPELNQVLEKIRADISVLEVKTFVSSDGTFIYEYDTLYDEFEGDYSEEASSDNTQAARHAKRRASCDTIIVPAQEDGFKRVFIGEDCWYAIRISAAMKDRIKYIAAYQSAPISAVTHIAEVKEIKPYRDSGKYEVIFKGPAKEIKPIPLKGDGRGYIQGPVYARRELLLKAESINEALAA